MLRTMVFVQTKIVPNTIMMKMEMKFRLILYSLMGTINYWMNNLGENQLMEYTVGEYKLHTGTILVIKHYGEEVEATFIGRNPSNVSRVVINVKGCRWFLTEKQLLEKLIHVTDRIDPKVHPPTI